MAKAKNSNIASKTVEPTVKGTSIGNGKVKRATMNKNKKRSYKKYRGQGK